MRTLHFIWTLLLLTCSLTIQAEKWTPETLPMVHLQDARRFVCNPDGILDEQTVRKTDQILQALKKDKGIESVVVVVKQLEGDDPFTFGMELSKRYGIGSARQNTGLIVILATEDRSYQILTGRGLEGTLPDAICRRIQNRVMVPQLKIGRWDSAIFNTVRSIDGYIRQDAGIRPDSLSEKHQGKDVTYSIIFTFLLLGGLFTGIILLTKYKNRCPKCKKGQMKMTEKKHVRLTQSLTQGTRIVYRCPHCGYEKVKFHPDDDFHQGGPVPPIFMGGPIFGSRGSGSDSWGGSFGGGDFDGGGSGGRF